MGPITPGSGSPSPPTSRVVAIIDHLAARPHRGFGLTELARDLGISKATCLAVLTTLTDSGYLVRHPTKRDYRLGPALVGAGRAAMSRFPDLSGARGFLGDASGDIGLAINVVALADDQIVICERVGATDPFAGYARIGVGVPFTPPYGAAFVAWSDISLWNRWVEGVDLAEAELRTLAESIRIANERGFVVTLETPPAAEYTGTVSHLRHLDRTIDPDQIADLAAKRLRDANFFLDEIDPDGTPHLNLIQVPVPDGSDGFPLALMATAFGKPFSGPEIHAAGERLRGAGRQLSEFLRSRR